MSLGIGFGKIVTREGWDGSACEDSKLKEGYEQIKKMRRNKVRISSFIVTLETKTNLCQTYGQI